MIKQQASENGTSGSIDLTIAFQRELATARANLNQSGLGQQAKESSINPRRCRPSYGHRAGFDAFMTAFAFACYAVQSSLKLVEEGGRVSLEGLADVNNCLACRPRNRKFPLRIVKSHFTKTSATHATAGERMKRLVSNAKEHPST